MVNTQLGTGLKMLVGSPVAVKVVEMVPVTVEEAINVVPLSPVALAVTTVVPTYELVIVLPAKVYVLFTTVTCVKVADVKTGTLVTVERVTTDSYVETGTVSVFVIVSSAAVLVALPNGAVVFKGCNVLVDTVGTPVGKGKLPGWPLVSSVGLIDPVVSGELCNAEVAVGDCWVDRLVSVIVCSEGPGLTIVVMDSATEPADASLAELLNVDCVVSVNDAVVPTGLDESRPKTIETVSISSAVMQDL